MEAGRYGRAVGIAAGETFVVLAPFAKVSKSARPSTVVKGTKEARNVEKILVKVSKRRGNFPVPVGGKNEALKAAERFVGKGAKPILHRTTGELVGMKSADGLKLYRIGVKDTGRHAGKEIINLVTKKTPKGSEYIRNAHLVWD